MKKKEARNIVQYSVDRYLVNEYISQTLLTQVTKLTHINHFDLSPVSDQYDQSDPHLEIFGFLISNRFYNSYSFN